MRLVIAFVGLLSVAQFLPIRAVSQPSEEAAAYSYADLADLSLAANIVARATIERASKLDEERAIGVPQGYARFYIEAELANLIRSDDAVPARINYLVDAPLDANGRSPRLRGRAVIILAQPVPGRRETVQLVSPDAQLPWSEAIETQIRAILVEAAAADAPGIVTGVGNAFSVPGALPGESETQIFLATSDGRPVSISVLRRPNQRPRWSVSLSEIVENASPPPQPNTLLWYRLACFLPPYLPETSLESMGRAQLDTARADYRMIVDHLGRCPRFRTY
jgi:hypothetical protein